MALNDHDQARIREYLLGRLSDEEQQKIEERLMVEDDLFEELEISKGELIEEYRAGELTQHDHSYFEHSFLATPEGKQRHLFAVAFDCIARPSPAPQHVSWFEKLRAFFGASPWPVFASALGALAILVLGYTGYLWIRNQPQTSIAFNLTNSVINRGSGDPRYHVVSLKPDVGEVKITLALPQSAPTGVNYRAQLDDRVNTTTLTPLSQDANSVLVVIPAKKLPPGLYSIKLIAIRPDGTEQRLAGDYLFQVTS
jgi:hypothetical protein